jgi:hypothetical protein
MTDSNTLYDEVLQEAVGPANQLQLDASGSQAFQQIFAATLGAYLTAYPDTDVFDHPAVMKFIRGQIRRIVTSARIEAGTGPITGEMLHRHAERVMKRTRDIFDMALDRAEVDLMIGPKRLAVSFCLAYIRHQAVVNPIVPPQSV